MFKKILFLTSLFFIGTHEIFAVDPTTIENSPTNPITQSDAPQTYETYHDLVGNYCEGTDKPWNDPADGGAIMSPPPYAELDAKAINSSISQTVTSENLPSEKQKLAQELDTARIGNIAGFKALEVARLQYRSTMNNTFACAIIDSRTQMLADLRKKINEKFPVPNSEILLKLEREEKKLEATRNTLPCAAVEKGGNNTVSMETKITNTATLQYCYYNYYLLYLKDNLEKDNARIMQVEKGIGTGNGTNIPTNSDAWIRELNARTSQISNELTHAANTLPRALRTFQEMKRTFSVHIMLVIIYDDYLRLRENLSTYFNATSQLFEKANNAQDTNKH